MEESSMADERAKAHFRVGQSLYDSGRFADAGAEWQQAYDLSQRVELLYNVYIAYRDASDLPHAIEALDRYLATAQIAPDLRVNLEARARAMRESEAKRAADEQAALQAASSEPAAPEAEPAPITNEPAVARVDAEGASRVAPYLLVAVGGSMLVGSLLTGIMASSAAGEIEDACPMDQCPASFDLESQRSNAKTLALVTDVLWIGGALAAGTGAVWLLVAGNSEQAPPATAACSHEGCYAAYNGTF
jgi:tetratricopeptide (TPR) repeat protein